WPPLQHPVFPGRPLPVQLLHPARPPFSGRHRADRLRIYLYHRTRLHRSLHRSICIMKKSAVVLWAVLLIGAGCAIATYKAWVLGMPLRADQEAEVWTVQTRIG